MNAPTLPESHLADVSHTLAHALCTVMQERSVQMTHVAVHVRIIKGADMHSMCKRSGWCTPSADRVL